jgi:hypothetical protein
MDNTIKQAVVSVEKLEDWKIKARYFEDGAELDALIDDMNVVINSAEEVDPYAYTWVDDGKGSTKDLPLYLHPAPLTELLSDQEIEGIFKRFVRKFYNTWGYEEGLHSNDLVDFARAIERKITEKKK